MDFLPKKSIRSASGITHVQRPDSVGRGMPPPVYRPEPQKVRPAPGAAMPLQQKPFRPLAVSSVPSINQKIPASAFQRQSQGAGTRPVLRSAISSSPSPGKSPFHYPQPQKLVAQAQGKQAAMTLPPPLSGKVTAPVPLITPTRMPPVGSMPVQRNIVSSRPGLPPASLRMVRVHSPQTVQRAVIGLQAPARNLEEIMKQQEEIKELVDSIAKRPDAGAKNPQFLDGIPNTESIYFVGHASPEGFAQFDANKLFQGLKEMKLAKNYRGKIILVGCETGVRRNWGLGPSLAGQLAAMLSADGYKCSVVGMTGFTFVLQSGDIRVHNDPAGYRRNLTDWNKRADSWSERKRKFRSSTSSTDTAEAIAEEKQSLLDELDETKKQHSRAFGRGSVEVRNSDSRYGQGLLLLGAGALALYYRQQLAATFLSST